MLLRIASLLALVGLSLPAARAEQCPAPAPADCCKPADAAPVQERKTPKLPRDTKAPIENTSESASLTRAGDATLEGKVVVRQGDREITAESALYNQETGDFSVTGDVIYREPDLWIKGGTGSWSSDIGAKVGDAEFELPKRPARGSAKEISVSPDGILSLKRVRFTTCPVGRDDWMLKAARITIDPSAEQGTGRNVRLDFMGVPVLYTPYISFPVTAARKTGFLFPDIGRSSKGGFEFATPYYFNLAPNYDLVVTPRLMTRRGVQGAGEFRYLTRTSRGTLEGDFLPGDDLAGGNRSYARLVHVTDFTDSLRLTADAANASDGNYFEDFRLGPENTSISYVERRAMLSYRGANVRADALVQNYQTIDQSIDRLVRPYTRLPQVLTSGDWPLAGGFHAAYDAEFVNFDRDDGVRGLRVDVAPELAWQLRGPGWFVTPSASYRYTYYDLRDTAPGADRSPSRSLPIAALDAGLVFDRTWKDGRYLQTLEPRALYTYAPYRNQDDLPVFDTGLPDLSMTQLFRTNRYLGRDRASDANQVAVGATSRIIDNRTGRERFSAMLGQIYYFETPRVALPGETAPRKSTSDLVAQMSVAVYRHWHLDWAQQWARGDSDTGRREFNLQYRPGGGRLVNLGYRFREDSVEQWEAAAVWPLNERWRVFARNVHSLRDHKAIETFAGVEYTSCCWRARLIGRRYVSNRTGERDTAVALQVELLGLSSVGKSSDAFLEHTVRGYSRDLSTPLP